MKHWGRGSHSRVGDVHSTGSARRSLTTGQGGDASIRAAHPPSPLLRRGGGEGETSLVLALGSNLFLGKGYWPPLSAIAAAAPQLLGVNMNTS